MNIQCESCEARYNLDARLFNDSRAVRVKCRKCGGYIVVAKPEAADVAPLPPLTVEPASPAAPRMAAGANVVPAPSERTPLRSMPPPQREERAVREVPKVRRTPSPSPPPVMTSAPPAPPPAATVGEEEWKTAGPAAGTSFLGNLLLFPSDGNVPPVAAGEKRPAATPSAPPSAPAYVPPSVRPSAPPPKPPPDPGWAARMSPTYNVSREVRLDLETLVENRCVAFFPNAPAVEAYRVLRTRILQAAGKKGGTTVMITSALPWEGKTVTAINLALTFSKTFLETALLVDCDLRQQQVHEVLGFESGLGLGDYLTDGCHVSDIMVWPGVEKLTLISGGKTVSESSELLGSPAMKELVEDMKNRYPNRYVFFDVPPVLAGADALAFAPLVDHILFVVRADVTPLPDVRKALAMLPAEKVIGLVLNRQKRR